MMKVHQFETTAAPVRGVTVTATGNKRRDISSPPPVLPDRYQHGTVFGNPQSSTPQYPWYQQQHTNQLQGGSNCCYAHSSNKRTCNRIIDTSITRSGTCSITHDNHDNTDEPMCIAVGDPTQAHATRSTIQRRVKRWVCDICHYTFEKDSNDASPDVVDGQVWNGFRERSRRLGSTSGCTHEEKSLLYVMASC
mmetsp:Transcript_14579/g.22493  ORF Transcript_14579/g.22493 Transcript_14579/m.22493 type:complete len:193 (+) Transcript_14579:134-712(+)